jgi:protein PET54
MSKLGKLASDTLSRLLYATKSQEISPKLGSVSRFLYEHNHPPSKSLLDDLLENDWKQRPVVDVLQDSAFNNVVKTNILRLSCPNSYISHGDFKNVFPINRERQFSLKDEYADGFPFQSVKARDPVTLLFQNAYYLVFQNHIHAAVYYKETVDKTINGINLKWEFVNLNKSHLRNLVSPYLGPNLPKSPIKPSWDFESLFSSSPQKLAHLNTLLALPENNYKSTELFNNFHLLSSVLDYNSRAITVLVRNLPFGLSKHTLPRLLWDYDLARSNPIIPLVNDPPKEISLNLLRFQSSKCANRFIRNFHGKRWDTMQHQQKEKKLYDPILCEVLEQE